MTITTEEAELLAQTHDLARSTLGMKAPEHDLTSAALRDLAAERDALRAENARLREALQSVLNACDQGRMLERGAGGMTIDAQIRRSFYYGVPAWPIEEARAVLGETQ